MAGQFSEWAANQILNKAFKGVDFSFPTSMYVALFLDNDGTHLRNNNLALATEVSGSGYTRLEIGDAIKFTSPSAGKIETDSSLVWSTVLGLWGTVKFGALITDSTGGDVVIFGGLATPKIIDTGDTVTIGASSLYISL